MKKIPIVAVMWVGVTGALVAWLGRADASIETTPLVAGSAVVAAIVVGGIAVLAT